MEKELKIRKATEDDIVTVELLAHAIWPQTYRDILNASQVDYMLELLYSQPSLKQQFSKHSFLIAEIDGEPVAFASYSPIQEPGVFKLHKLYVKRGEQGAGLGRSLINHIIEEMKTANARALDLNVNRNNNARLFYEKLGFTIIRQEDIDIGNGYWMNDYVMRKTI